MCHRQDLNQQWPACLVVCEYYSDVLEKIRSKHVSHVVASMNF